MLDPETKYRISESENQIYSLTNRLENLEADLEELLELHNNLMSALSDLNTKKET